MQLGGLIYVLWIVVIAIILLAFLPCINFCFQLCFDTTTAVASVATRGRVKATNTAAGGGQTRITRGINPLASAAISRGTAASQRAEASVRPGARKARSSLGGNSGAGREANAAAADGAAAFKQLGVSGALKLARQSRGTRALVEDGAPDFELDDIADEQFLSPQRRRALMRARLGIPTAQTGVFRGFANRVVSLTQYAINLGMPSTTRATDAVKHHKLLGEAYADDDDDEPQETAPGTESGDEEQRRGLPVASGHGTAYDDLARRIAVAS